MRGVSVVRHVRYARSWWGHAIVQARTRIRHPSESLLVTIQMDDAPIHMNGNTSYLQAGLDVIQIYTHTRTHTNGNIALLDAFIGMMFSLTMGTISQLRSTNAW